MSSDSSASEYPALRDACGLIDRSQVARLELRGADRVRFLNGFVTCDVESPAPGHGVYGFLTEIKGRVIADLVVLVLEDRLWLELPEGTGEEIAAHLRKHVIADQVEIRTLDDMIPLTLIGPRATGVLGDVEPPICPPPGEPPICPPPGEPPICPPPGEPLPEETFRHRRVSILGHQVRLVREPELGVPVWTLWASASIAAALSEALFERGEGYGLRAVGRRAFEILRVEAGRPLFGQDFGAENFPQEIAANRPGMEEAVSYTKGCYLGQEVVARIHHRGGVQRVLRGLVFAPGAGAPAGGKILHDGREAGLVTSAVESPSRGRILGLSILHQRAAEPGTRIEIEGGGEAEVVELPFDLDRSRATS
ncbi:MAG: hypothetical protein GY856_45710 [bacterium]|nr:hypothetical protein [bacterium]